MKLKTMLAAAIAALALAAVPAFASAAVEIDYPGTNGHFTVSGGAAKLTSDSDSITCTSVTGTGTFENKTTGHIELTFHGCKEELGRSTARPPASRPGQSQPQTCRSTSSASQAANRGS